MRLKKPTHDFAFRSGVSAERRQIGERHYGALPGRRYAEACVRGDPSMRRP
jgi:hypothetical protein